MRHILANRDIAKAKLPKQVRSPSIDSLGHKLLIPGLANLEPYLLELIDSNNTESINPYLFIEILNHTASDLIVDCNLACLRESNPGDEVTDLVLTPVFDGPDHTLLQGQEMVVA